MLCATRREFLDALAPRIYFHFYFLFYFRYFNPLKINEISLLDWIVFREIYVYLQRILQRMQIYLLNFSDEPRPLTRFTSKTKYTLELCLGADFNHSVFGAVAGLSENMAGLRFSYTHKLVLACQKE